MSTKTAKKRKNAETVKSVKIPKLRILLKKRFLQIFKNLEKNLEMTPSVYQLSYQSLMKWKNVNR